MKNIDKKISFYIDERHSNKKNQDYFPVILKINDDIEIFIGFLTKSQYDTLKSLN